MQALIKVLGKVARVMVARSVWKIPGYKHIIRRSRTIAVDRPQDVGNQGKGKIVGIKAGKVIGQGTDFHNLNENGFLVIDGESIKIKEIICETQIAIENQNTKTFP